MAIINSKLLNYQRVSHLSVELPPQVIVAIPIRSAWLGPADV